RGAGPVQRLLRLAPLGYVAGHLGVADQLAGGLVVDGADHHRGPEALPVLAQAPALLLEAPVGRGIRERRLRLAGEAVFLGIEGGEVLAEDLVGGVALEPLGAGVPADHAPLVIHHVDRVVRDGVDEELESTLLESPLTGAVAASGCCHVSESSLRPSRSVAGHARRAVDCSPLAGIPPGTRPFPA